MKILGTSLAGISYAWVSIVLCRTVEVHFIDTGKSGRVSIGDLCTHVPELTLQIPSQALQCNLDGVTMVTAMCMQYCDSEAILYRIPKVYKKRKSVELPIALHKNCARSNVTYPVNCT